jgi:homoserine dehydrogenase
LEPSEPASRKSCSRACLDPTAGRVPVELLRIADLDITRDRGVAVPPGVLTTDVKQVLADPAIDIVIELVGGYDFAKRVMLDAIAAGKHVVTANKALLALHGEEIFAAAESQHVDLGFEASVGGGIPVIRALTEGLAANVSNRSTALSTGRRIIFSPG